VEPKVGRSDPLCIAGNGACPPEDCGGPETFMEHRDDLLSLEGREDLATMAEVISDIVARRRLDLLDDEETRWRVDGALERSEVRERAQGRPFTRRSVNARLGRGEHRELMHQQ
jgi:hypothetical protein